MNTTTLYEVADTAYQTLPPACAARLTKAIALVEAEAIERIADGYVVRSQSHADAAYHVTDARGCNCPDAQRAPVVNNRPACKHQIAVWLHRRLTPAPAPVARPDAGGMYARKTNRLL